MKLFRKLSAFIFLILIEPVSLISGQSGIRTVSCFDSEWRFTQGDPQGASEAGFDDRTWQLLDLPHDWSIEGTVSQDAPAGGSGGYYPTGTGWYRKHFSIKKEDLKTNHLIIFDGVYMNSDVWINGKHLGNYPFGYNSFWYNLDDHLKAGENVIAVRVDNSKQPASRWYSGPGIYRHAWLNKTNKVHIAQWGVYITTPQVTEENASVSAEVRVENASGSLQYASPQINPTTADLHLSWDVPCEPGSVKAVGKKNGKIVCTEIIETTGKPVAIRLTSDVNNIKADNQDVAHVKIEVIDDRGRIVPTADNLINYKISGNGKLIGLDNGNPSDYEPYNSGKRKVFNGLGLAIIQAGKIPGQITLTASSEGMKDVSVGITVLK